MADPKYAALPGIVYDQPDIYETSDLPESDQDLVLTDTLDTSEAIETLHISGSDAHTVFKGKVLDSSKVDFSDRISRAGHKGYSARRIEWDIGGEGEDETVVQKYQRLMCETNDLMQEVQQIKGDVACADGSVSATDLNTQIDTLHKTLCDLKLEEQLGTEVVASITEPQMALQKKLVNLLENFKKKGLMPVKSEQKQSSGGAVDGSDNITYELYYAPEHAKLNQLAHAATIEKRIDFLESLLGNNPEKMSSLSTWTNHKTIVGAVQVLSSRLALLEPAHLDHIEGRLHSVHTRMNSIAEKKAAIDDADKQSKVNDLYELTQKSEVLCSAVPDVVDRMVSLEALHDEATQFSRSLKQLEVTQTQLSGILQNNTQLLDKVQNKFTKNMEAIQNSIESLDKRIQTLSK